MAVHFPEEMLFTVCQEMLADGVAERGELEERLERGNILFFPRGIFELPPQEDMVFLRQELPKLLSFKNISYHPEGDYLTGMKMDPARRKRTIRILREHHRVVAPFLRRVLPHYAESMQAGKVNFRPLEERGRTLSVRASNELIHVDALASGPTHGARILRFFTNIHPEQVRIWKSAGVFSELFAEFREAAGLAGVDAASLKPGPFKRMLSRFLGWLAGAGFPQAQMGLDVPPYDRAMRRFHNFLKENSNFQGDQSRIRTCEFPPFSTWMVLTDMVSHAVISGCHALVNTYHVPLYACRLPQLAPYNILASTESTV